MNEKSQETLTLSGEKPEKQKRVAGRKTRKFKKGSAAATWDYVPPELIPAGYTVEWKNVSIYGQPVESDYHVFLQDQGWEYASVEQFGPMLGAKKEGKNTIERRGQVLMIRPKELTDEARAEESLAAREQVRGKLEQLGMATPGQFERTQVQHKKSYERVTVPEE